MSIIVPFPHFHIFIYYRQRRQCGKGRQRRQRGRQRGRQCRQLQRRQRRQRKQRRQYLPKNIDGLPNIIETHRHFRGSN